LVEACLAPPLECDVSVPVDAITFSFLRDPNDLVR
jgi:hypothetical protein